MPKEPGRRKTRGRKRKFQPGSKVQWVEGGVADDGSPTNYLRYGVVVEYRQYRTKAYYYVVPVEHMRVRGTVKRFESHKIEAAEFPIDGDKAARVYALNHTITDRGCACQCCVHTAVPRRFWDSEEGYL